MAADTCWFTCVFLIAGHPDTMCAAQRVPSRNRACAHLLRCIGRLLLLLQALPHAGQHLSLTQRQRSSAEAGQRNPKCFLTTDPVQQDVCQPASCSSSKDVAGAPYHGRWKILLTCENAALCLPARFKLTCGTDTDVQLQAIL
jgi:hypothetical protein